MLFIVQRQDLFSVMLGWYIQLAVWVNWISFKITYYGLYMNAVSARVHDGEHRQDGGQCKHLT